MISLVSSDSASVQATTSVAEVPAQQQPAFVKPYFIPELGCEGLTSQEIADSLGMEKNKVHTLITKLQTSGDLSQIRQSTVSIDGINKSMIYLINTDDAKFIVTQSSTKLGRAYCRFLIECEKVITQLATPALTLDTAIALANQAYQALLLERAEKEKALAQAAYQDKALTTSQQNNAKLTVSVTKLKKENRRLTLVCAGMLEWSTIAQFKAAVGIISTKNSNSLVSKLSKMCDAQGLEVKKIIVGDEKWPSKAFNIAFLNANTELIHNYFGIVKEDEHD